MQKRCLGVQLVKVATLMCCLGRSAVAANAKAPPSDHEERPLADVGLQRPNTIPLTNRELMNTFKGQLEALLARDPSSRYPAGERLRWSDDGAYLKIPHWVLVQFGDVGLIEALGYHTIDCAYSALYGICFACDAEGWISSDGRACATGYMDVDDHGATLYIL